MTTNFLLTKLVSLRHDFFPVGDDKTTINYYQQPGKLAVILHADIVNSTAMLHRNEVLVHDRIKSTFKRFGAVISSYRGSVRELRGDALVAEFDRASDAVAAALKFQQNQSFYNEQLEDEIRLELRIGIALGEIIIDENTVTSVGVVLAQRVEQLAQAGGLCITAAIHEALPSRMLFDQEYIGEHELKGFDELKHVYRVIVRPGELIPVPQGSRLRFNLKKVSRAVIILGLTIGGGATISSGYKHFNTAPQMSTHWLAPAIEALRQNPVSASASSIEQGAVSYEQNCVSCHGANADGYGPKGRNLNPRPADLRSITQMHTDGELAYKIKVGRGSMPGWQGILNETEIWGLINYIRTLDR